MEEATQQFLREIDERESREALLPPKIGSNPNRPWHPVCNPESLATVPTYSPADPPPSKECTASQKTIWYEAIKLIRERKFSTRFALGVYYKHSERWAGDLVRAMVDQHVFTREEVRQLIKQKGVSK